MREARYCACSAPHGSHAQVEGGIVVANNASSGVHLLNFGTILLTQIVRIPHLKRTGRAHMVDAAFNRLSKSNGF